MVESRRVLGIASRDLLRRCDLHLHMGRPLGRIARSRLLGPEAHQALRGSGGWLPAMVVRRSRANRLDLLLTPIYALEMLAFERHLIQVVPPPRSILHRPPFW